jgi:6-phosphofructokinase 2
MDFPQGRESDRVGFVGFVLICVNIAAPAFAIQYSSDEDRGEDASRAFASFLRSVDIAAIAAQSDMSMNTVLTITANPALDVSMSVPQIVPFRKLRCSAPRRDPGGGGINVARVAARLGNVATALYTIGGSTGQQLRRLLDREGVRSIAIDVVEDTREDFTVLEEASGNQFRFVLPGQHLAPAEYQACLAALSAIADLPPYVVGSGSLAPGMPAGFYAEATRIVNGRGSQMILDTSGEALAAALGEGVYLVKPSLRELRELTRAPLLDLGEQLAACRTLIARGGAQNVALTLGEEGALLATPDAAFWADAPEVRAISTVGAGDSFVGALVSNLAAGLALPEAFRRGVAAGSAAALNAGTELCHAEDVARLSAQVTLRSL